MTHRVFIILSSLFILNFSGFIAGVSQGACPDGMTAYWKLDKTDSETWADEISGNDGVCSGDCPFFVKYERVNGSFYFNGQTTGISVPASDAFDWENDRSFSLEYWIKRPAGGFSGNEAVIGRHDADTGMKWWSGLDSNGMAFFSLTSTSGETFTLTGTSTVADGTWHHIAVTRDAAQGILRLVVDINVEAVEESVVYTTGFGSETASLTIGWLDADDAGRFRGQIDEIALYNKVIADDIIVSHLFDGLADFRQGYCEQTRLRIMPLGNSITAGVEYDNTLEAGLMAGYRWKLYTELTNLGYDVDFVGSQSYGYNITPAFDTDNEGHPGITDSTVANSVYSWLSANPADIVLLHIGTNAIDSSPGDVSNILDEIDRYSEDVTVILARIINRDDEFSDTSSQFNENITIMAKERIRRGDKIIIVDMENALTYPDDLSDNLHPNTEGYEKMATVWLTSLLRYTSFPDIVPFFSTAPVTTATVAALYTYTVQAEGKPEPVYSFADKSTIPEGMTINSKTGLIQWTPFSEGNFTISVRASNDAGNTDQTFTITVLPRTNQAPVANAGEDQMVVEGDIVFLDGSQSVDPDGGVVSYKWEQVAGTPVTLSAPSSPATSFTAPDVGEFAPTFRLTVTDGGGLRGFDEVTIIVNSAFSPVANAGVDQAVKNGSTVILNGSKSFAGNGQTLLYQWKQISGTPVTLSTSTQSVTSFVAPTSGKDDVSLFFSLTVTDDMGRESSDEVTVTVSFINLPPVSVAGNDRSVISGTTVTLDGSSSYDPDSGIASWQWTQTEGTTVVLARPDAATTTFIAPEVGTEGLVFQLTVTDKGGLGNTDEVLVTVNNNSISGLPDGAIRFTTATGRSMGLFEQTGGKFTAISPVAESTVSDTLDRPEDFVYGLLNTEIRLDSPGGSAVVTVFLTEALPSDYEWYEYSATEGWRSFGDRAVFSADRKQIYLTFTDGGIGDGSSSAVAADGFCQSISGPGIIRPGQKEDKNSLLGCFISTSGEQDALPLPCVFIFLPGWLVWMAMRRIFRVGNS